MVSTKLTAQERWERGMMEVGVGMFMGCGLLVLGQTDAASNLFQHSDLVIQGGALGVLTLAVFHAYKNLVPALRKEILENRIADEARSERQRLEFINALAESQETFSAALTDILERHERIQKDTNDRHERQETQRHLDSEAIQQALTKMSQTCAAVRGI